MRKVLICLVLFSFNVSADFIKDNATNIVRDSNTKFVWQDNTDVVDKTKKKNWKEAINYCANLSLGGYKNWRLPNKHELLSIVDKSRKYVTINNAFENAYSSYYWSSSEDDIFSDQAVYVNFKKGSTDFYDKDAYVYVRCVRDNFTRDDTTNTVSDSDTKLIWQDNTDVADKTKKKNWGKAINYCKNLSLGGYKDWRLPSKKELLTIVDKSYDRVPTISGAFKNFTSNSYWSSTTDASNTSYAWDVHFYIGYTGKDNRKSKNYYVRCVRGRQ